MTELIQRAPSVPMAAVPMVVAPMVAVPQLVEPGRTEPALQRVMPPAVAPDPRDSVDSAPPRLSAESAAKPHIPVAAPSLRGRAAAYSVTKECLRLQALAQPRSRLARVFGRDPLHPDAASWYRGALGELEVARILSRLDRGWTVLHAVPVGSRGADIDHVVIGPGGNFTINTKNHGGKKIWAAGSVFMVDGQKRAHIRNSLHEAERAARLLTDVAGTPVAVTPLIVVVNPESLVRKKPDVVVMSSTDLRLWLRRRPQMQTDAAVARIVWAAERGDTWTSDEGDARAISERAGVSGQAGVSGHAGVSAHAGVGHAGVSAQAGVSGLYGVSGQAEASSQERRFAELRADVDAARSRRQAWSLLGATAFLAAVIAAAVAVAPFVPAIISALMGAR